MNVIQLGLADDSVASFIGATVYEQAELCEQEARRSLQLLKCEAFARQQREVRPIMRRVYRGAVLAVDRFHRQCCAHIDCARAGAGRTLNHDQIEGQISCHCNTSFADIASGLGGALLDVLANLGDCQGSLGQARAAVILRAEGVTALSALCVSAQVTPAPITGAMFRRHARSVEVRKRAFDRVAMNARCAERELRADRLRCQRSSRSAQRAQVA